MTMMLLNAVSKLFAKVSNFFCENINFFFHQFIIIKPFKFDMKV
jgi:hypothetical protein